MKVVKYILIAVTVPIIAVVWVQTFTKIAKGCPADQVLIKSVYTYECISR